MLSILGMTGSRKVSFMKYHAKIVSMTRASIKNVSRLAVHVRVHGRVEKNCMMMSKHLAAVLISNTEPHLVLK